MTLPKDMGGPHYVVVIENDGPPIPPPEGWLVWHETVHPEAPYTPEPRGPMVWETYLGIATSSLEAAISQQKLIGDRYGQTRIARLVFVQEGA